MLLFIHPLLQSKQWLLISRRFSLFVHRQRLFFLHHTTCIHFSLPSVVSVILLSTCITTSLTLSLRLLVIHYSNPAVCSHQSASLKVLNAALSGHHVQS